MLGGSEVITAWCAIGSSHRVALGGRLRFRHPIEALGAALFFGVFGVLPLDWASAVGGALARAVGPRLGITKRARLNLTRALPALSEAEVTRIITAMWDNLGRVAAEYPHLRKIRIFDPAGRVETHGFENMDRAVARGRRMIIFSGHIVKEALQKASVNDRGMMCIGVHWWAGVWGNEAADPGDGGGV